MLWSCTITFYEGRTCQKDMTKVGAVTDKKALYAKLMIVWHCKCAMIGRRLRSCETRAARGGIAVRALIVDAR